VFVAAVELSVAAGVATVVLEAMEGSVALESEATEGSAAGAATGGISVEETSGDVAVLDGARAAQAAGAL
jgi:hypothetical protein